MAAAKLALLDSLPAEVLGLFHQLYEVERESRAAQNTAAQRLARRQQRSVALMAALKARLVAIRQQIMPGTKLAKACDYALGQWSRLEVYLQNGVVLPPPDWRSWPGNLLTTIRRESWIINTGSRKAPRWLLVAKNKKNKRPPPHPQRAAVSTTCWVRFRSLAPDMVNPMLATMAEKRINHLPPPHRCTRLQIRRPPLWPSAA